MRTVILIVAIFLSLYSAEAQYSKYKRNYNVKMYSYEKTDRYSPVVAGTLAIIPGLGHVYAGEPLRGLSFFGGAVGSAGIVFLGAYLAFTDIQVLPYIFLFSGCTAFLATYICNFIDAVKVSKVKNMALDDKAISCKFQPELMVNLKGVRTYSIGISLKVNF
jgi:hypothetical protein